MPEQRRPHLSGRQRQVLALLACGLRDNDMAATLGISPRTVRMHVDQLRGKLGITRRHQLFAAYRQLGGEDLLAGISVVTGSVQDSPENSPDAGGVLPSARIADLNDSLLSAARQRLTAMDDRSRRA